MLERNTSYAADEVSPFVASFTDRGVGLEAHSNKTGISVQFIGTVDEVLVDHIEMQWVGGALKSYYLKLNSSRVLFEE